MQKAKLIVESKKETTLKINAGFYSERAMKDDLKFPSQLCLTVSIPRVSKTIYV